MIVYAVMNEGAWMTVDSLWHDERTAKAKADELNAADEREEGSRPWSVKAYEVGTDQHPPSA